MVTANAKFIARAYINDIKVDMTDHWVMLKHSSPGNCQIKVKSTPNKLDIVAVELGWGDMIDRVFLGFVERVQPAEAGWSIIFCRELSASLAFNLSVMLRHPTLRQVISEISQQTGLEFVIPEKVYADTAIPAFYCDSSGYAMLDNIGSTFKVPDFIWQQQGNGKIYIGSYQDSFWFDKPITIPTNIMTNQQAGKSVNMPAAPMIRPNVTANNERITAVEFKGTNMTITWG